MTTWIKQIDLPSYLQYEITCYLKDQGKWQWLPQQHEYIEILDNFIIILTEDWPSDEVIFQDDNASFHRTKGH